MEPTRLVKAGDGVPLAVYAEGEPTAPSTVLAVHGYPDNASMWDAVAGLLAAGHRVLRYDVRGTGRSGAPAGRAGYRLEQLAEDARAVLDAMAPDRPVHLLGHDWGSVQGWYFLTSPRLAGRFASFTSISGPCLDYVRPWLRSELRGGRPGPVLSQLAHSSYIPFFLLPALPEWGWRSGLVDRLLGSAPTARRGLPDKLHGLQLYRANLLRLERRAPQPIEIPVQVLAPSRDRYVGVRLQLEAPRPYVRRLQGRTVDGGHWLPVTKPDVVASAVAEFIADLAGQTD
jgi:pimeloyl-ACP methyl ester carboxylesterase